MQRVNHILSLPKAVKSPGFFRHLWKLTVFPIGQEQAGSETIAYSLPSSSNIAYTSLTTRSCGVYFFSPDVEIAANSACIRDRESNEPVL